MVSIALSMYRPGISTYVFLLLGAALIGGDLATSQSVSSGSGKQGITKMKIAPYTENWNEGERDWSFVTDPRAAIEAWEKTNAMTLPDDYRTFLLKYNGGSVFPRLFKHKMEPLETGPYVDERGETYLDLLFPWKSVESHWLGKTYGKGVPPLHLVIGDTPGGIQVLMSLTPTERGKIYSWYHSTSPWGSGGNTKVHLLAGSFSEFLKSLYDDGDDYEQWHMPLYDTLAKDVEL